MFFSQCPRFSPVLPGSTEQGVQVNMRYCLKPPPNVRIMAMALATNLASSDTAPAERPHPTARNDERSATDTV